MPSPLEQLMGSLPDGAAWVSGRFFKRLLQVLIADRARLAPTSGNEIAMPDGRFFDISPGSAASLADPWQPLAGTTDPTKVRVAPFSTLNEFDPTNITKTFAVAGIADEFAMAAGDPLYLELDYNTDLTLSSVNLAAGRWDGYPQMYRLDGDGTLASPQYIGSAYFRLAHAVAASSTTDPPGLTLGNVRIIRDVFTPLALQPVYLAGYVVVFPVPWTR